MGAFLALLPTILQLIPSIIVFIESTHGAAPGQGATKLQAATDLLSVAVPALAPVLTTDPAKQSLINDVFALGVKIMNAAGTMPAAPEFTTTSPARAPGTHP